MEELLDDSNNTESHLRKLFLKLIRLEICLRLSHLQLLLVLQTVTVLFS